MPPHLSSLPAIDSTYPAVAENLACDEALLVAAEQGDGPPILRFWELDHPAVVLGASCRLAQDVKVEACRADGVPIARRSSGGGTVVIGPGALNVTLVLPLAADPAAYRAVDTAQRAVLDRVAGSLRAEGPPVEMLGSGDLAVGGRKVAGSAQRRLRAHMMIHFSLLYDFDLPRIDRYLAMPPRQPAYRAGRSHLDFVANLPLPRASIVAAIRSAWADPAGAPAPPPPPLPFGRIEALAAEKFRDVCWIERL